MELRFEALWKTAGGPELVPEYRFLPTRRWRADFAHLPSLTLFEIEGGVLSGGRHTRGAGFVKDCWKYQAAWLEGFSVVRLTAPQLTALNVAQLVARVTGNPVEPIVLRSEDKVGKRGQMSHKNTRGVGRSLCSSAQVKKIPLNRPINALHERLRAIQTARRASAVSAP